MDYLDKTEINLAINFVQDRGWRIPSCFYEYDFDIPDFLKPLLLLNKKLAVIRADIWSTKFELKDAIMDGLNSQPRMLVMTFLKSAECENCEVDLCGLRSTLAKIVEDLGYDVW